MEAVLSAIDSIAHLMDDHGWAVVSFLFILFIWFIPWVRQLQKDNALKQVLTTDRINDAVEHEQEITTILNHAMTLAKAEWAILWQFYNGTFSTSGVPYYKMSVTNEVVKDGYNGRAADFQNIPIILFADAIRDINKHGYIRVSVDDNKYKTICDIYTKEGINCGYYFKIINAKNMFAGILSVTFTKSTTLDQVAILGICSLAHRIAIIMALMADVTPKFRRKGDKR